MLNLERPKDWTSPVDYRNGTVHVRLEVLEKPAGDEPTTWSIYYIPNKGQKNGYGCLGTDIYKKIGVYEKDISMKSFWENDSIVWAEGNKQMDLVIKDESGGSGNAHKRSYSEKFFPTKVRLTGPAALAECFHVGRFAPRPAVSVVGTAHCILLINDRSGQNRQFHFGCQYV